MGTPGSGGDPTEAVGLLERSSLLDELSGLLAGAAGSGGRMVLVSGEAGIGKSALVRRFADRHAADTRVLTGACDPLLTPRALGPLHDIARQTGGRLAELLGAGGPREAVFAAFLDELEHKGQPGTVVVVEDAHWADEATLDLLVFVGRRLQRVPALLLVTFRDDELGADHPLRLALASLPQGMAHRVPLPPLSAVAVAELARRHGRSVARLYALTGGNPLLVTELLAAGEPGVPGTVRDLVLVRLARLPATAQQAVRLVAVVPGRAELWLLERSLGPDAAMVEAGVAAGLLVLGEETVGFRHELLRLAVEGSLTTFSRRELNRRVLRLLADTPGVDVARLAHHARQAGDVDAVLRHAPEAARQAAAVGAHRQAAEHYRAALVYADHLAPLVRAELLEGYSLEAYLSGFAEQALPARRTALEIREAAGDAEKAGENLRWLSRLHWWTGNRAEAEAAAARAIAVLETLPAGRQLAMAYSNRSQLEMVAHRGEPAVAWGSRAMELARRLGDSETLAHALTNIGGAHLQRDQSRGEAELEQAFETAAAAGLDDHAARALCALAGTLWEFRAYQRTATHLARGLRFAADHDLDGYAQFLTGTRANCRLEQGDWAAAERDARAALARGRSQVLISKVHRWLALVALGRLQARRDDPQATATLDEAAASAFGTGELQGIGPVAAARAEHAWLQGEPTRVAVEATRGFDLAMQADHPWYVGELALWLWRVGALAEVPAVAAQPYRLLMTGQWRAAAQAWETMGCPYEQAEALAHGDDEAAARALRLLDGLGASQTARLLRHQLRRRGRLRVPRGPSRTTSANPAGLTSRQLEVLALLAGGLSNADIAARLSLSPRTVDHHVSAVLGKLAVSSRRQAAAAAHRLGVASVIDGQPASQS